MSYDKKHAGQCVEYIQYITGNYKNIKGIAGKIKPNTQEAYPGHAIITTEGRYGHIALVIDIIGDKLILAESNYRGDEIVQTGRKMNINDERIIGYFDFNNYEGHGPE